MIANTIKKKIEKGEQISPFLFLGSNLRALNMELESVIQELQEHYNFPKSYIYRLEDDGENIKIAQTRTFFEKIHIGLDYKVQIFVIENITRLGISSSNSLLKILEEPGVGNLIFLTNRSESGILDTVLSRVQCVRTDTDKKEEFTEYIETLISDYVDKKNIDILGYYFTKQFEKNDAVLFLYALIELNKKNGKYSFLLENIQSDLNGLSNNNFNSKFVIDKYILELDKLSK